MLKMRRKEKQSAIRIVPGKLLPVDRRLSPETEELQPNGEGSMEKGREEN